jgi:hypothetical protein
MYYTVTQGRARALERLNLLDRSTYGIDWIVLDASTARDALRQWGLFKAGTHPFQGALELEVARYRTNAPGYVPAWEAESEVVSSDIERTIGAVAAQRRELDELQARLDDLRGEVFGEPRPRSRARRSRRRKPPRRAPRSAQGRRAA